MASKAVMSLVEAKTYLVRAMRRADGKAATYWAAYLVASHNEKELLCTLLIFAFENVGPADPSIVEVVLNAYRRFGKTLKDDFRFLVHECVLRLCAAEKTRLLEHATIAVVAPILENGNFVATSKSSLIEECLAKRLEGALRYMAKDLSARGPEFVLRTLAQPKLLGLDSRAVPLFDAARILANEKRSCEAALSHLVYVAVKGWLPPRPPAAALSGDERAEMEDLYEMLDGVAVVRDAGEGDVNFRGYFKGCVAKYVVEEQEALTPKSAQFMIENDPFFLAATTCGAELIEERLRKVSERIEPPLQKRRKK